MCAVEQMIRSGAGGVYYMAMFPLLAFFFGTIVGSFLNVMVMRHGAKPVTGRSACLSCGYRIPWYDNVPIISWFALGGRCRHCGSRISIQYPLVEALTGVLFVAAAFTLLPLHGTMSLQDVLVLILYGVVTSLFVAIAVYDIRHTIIPDAWVYIASLVALTIVLTTSYAAPYLTLLSGPAAALPLLVLWIVSRGAWMGLGDVKLALAIGWMLGPLYGVAAVFLAFVIGAFVSLFILLPMPQYLAILRQTGIARWRVAPASFTMKSEVAFGPFLVAAFFIVWLALLYEIPLPL